MSSNVTTVLGAFLILSISLGGYLTIKYLRMREEDSKKERKRKMKSKSD